MSDPVADAYGRASDAVRPLMGGIPDGHIAVGAMDGWTAVIPDPACALDAPDVARIIPADWPGRILDDALD